MDTTNMVQTLSSRNSRGSPRFLDLPPEIRDEIYSYLLDTRRVHRVVEDGRLLYRFHAAVLRTSRAIYQEAWGIFRKNLFVRVMCVGPEEYDISGRQHIARADPISVRAATITIADIDVRVHTERNFERWTHYQIVPLSALDLYFTYLAVRQVPSFPSAFRGFPILDSLPTVSYSIRVTMTMRGEPRGGMQLLEKVQDKFLEHEESLVLGVLRMLRHRDNKITITFKGKSDVLPKNPPDSLEACALHVFELAQKFKDHLDSLYLELGVQLLATSTQLIYDYRDLCVSLQAFILSCQDAAPRLLLGESNSRGSIVALLCACFYCYAYLYRRHPCDDSDNWPFEQVCDSERCLCQGLLHLNLSMDSTAPPRSLGISPRLWARLQHLSTIIHQVQDTEDLAPDLEDIRHRLHELQVHLATLGDFEDSLEHDIGVVDHAISVGLHPQPGTMETDVDALRWILWCRLSVHARPACIIGNDGLAKRS